MTTPRRSLPHLPGRARMGGAMLLEALVAILIFSVGILGVVGMQATAVQQSTDARYRTEASRLVDQLIGEMWTSDRVVSNLQAQFNTCSSSSCARYEAWYARVATTLPGVTPAIKPTVNVDANGLVTVSVFWLAPWEASSPSPHRYDSTAQIQQ